MHQITDRPEAVRKLGEMIKDIDFAMLTTVCDDGTLRSRPMSTQKRDFDGDLWFFTEIDSPKIHEMMHDRHVNVAYADPRKQHYVSVSGVATIVQDRARIEELWQPALKAWFPKGKDDPSIGLIKVHVTDAEYWDTPSSKVMHLFGFMKAVATGQKYQPGENEKLHLDNAPPTVQPGEATASHDPPPGPGKQHGDPLGSAAGLNP